MKGLKRSVLIASTLILLLVPLIALPSTPQQTAGPIFVVQAQSKPDSCPDMVRKAVQKTTSQCGNTGRNKACYGNSSIDAVAQSGVTDLKFAKPGDITDIKNLKTIKLGKLDESAQTWGIAMLRVQANLPDTAPGQNVTVLMFGDVELTDNAPDASAAQSTQLAASQTALAPTLSAADTMVVPTKINDITMEASAASGYETEVYQTPNAYQTAVESTLEARSTAQQATAYARSTNQAGTLQGRLASQSPSQQVQATNQNGTTVSRSQAQDSTSQARSTAQYATTWAQSTAQSLRQEAQVTRIFATAFAQETAAFSTQIAPPAATPYKTMQAFYFRSGTGEAACAEAPADGILVQTPQGSQRVKMTINGADIFVGSTIFIASPRGGPKMTVTTLEGGVAVSAFGVSKAVQPGASVTLPLDSNGIVNGPPDDPAPADANLLKPLPIRALPRFIQLPKPLTAPVPGSIKVGSLGDACVKGPLMAGGQGQPFGSVIGVYVGSPWSAKAGTTATFKASGSILLQSAWRDVILLTTNGDPSAYGDIDDAEYDDAVSSYAGLIASSGGSDTLTYTFTKDIPRFYVGVGSAAPGSVSVTVTCDVPAAAPTALTLTPSATNTLTTK